MSPCFNQYGAWSMKHGFSHVSNNIRNSLNCHFSACVRPLAQMQNPLRKPLKGGCVGEKKEINFPCVTRMLQAGASIALHPAHCKFKVGFCPGVWFALRQTISEAGSLRHKPSRPQCRAPNAVGYGYGGTHSGSVTSLRCRSEPNEE